MRQLDLDVINFEFDLECSAVHATVPCKEGKRVLLCFTAMYKGEAQNSCALLCPLYGDTANPSKPLLYKKRCALSMKPWLTIWYPLGTQDGLLW